ncbi:MAG: MFS transporter [Alphaproteobacteria bacterium]|nr:MFS transporter [Alphaproteobacteria bacterium]
MASTIDSRPADTGIRGLIQNPNYLSIWILGTLTGFIRWFQLLALGVYTFEITGSPLLVSLIPVMWGLPLTFCGPVIGGIADRLNRKLLLGLSLALILAVSTVMAVLAYTDNLTFIHIAIASLLSGLFWATDMPVRRRLVGDLAGDSVSAAMGLDAATNSATRMAGPLFGGIILQTVGITGVFVLSTTVYAIGLVLIVFARLPAHVKRAMSPALILDLIAGVRFVLGDWELRRVFAVTIVFNVWGFPFTAMIPILGKEQLGLDPFLVGLLSSLEGFGAFAGALLIAVVSKPGNFARIFVWGAAGYLLTILYLSILAYVAGGPYHSFITASMALVVIGISGAGFATMQSTLTYMNAPLEYRSRVFGVLALCIGTGPIGFLNVGWMAESFGLPTALLIMAIEGMLVMLLLWVYDVLARPTE